MAVWFTLTLFVSAALLFLIQPLFARMLLPLLGGSPSVWNTCMVFFQAALLAGYAAAHALPSWLGVRRHALLHLVLMAAALAVLPLTLPPGWIPPADGTPVLWLLGVLSVSVGLPFFVVATSGPLLQRWFAQTSHPRASDPYFLYAASNAGSLLGLLCYPLLLEPWLPLAEQSRLWTGGYLLLLLLTAGCAAILLLSGKRQQGLTSSESSLARRASKVAWRWLLLAFVPSSLLLSVTTYLTTDIAAVPLLWVAPLSLYLLTFILAFNRWPPLPFHFLARWSPLLMLILAVLLLTEATDPVWAVLPLHLLGLFWIGLVCHGQLARERPPARELTAFYLWIALGGVLGGVFNALLAPLIFDRLVEYPLVLVLACLLLPSYQTNQLPANWRDVLLPAIVGGLTASLVVVVWMLDLPGALGVAVIFSVPAILCYTFHERPLRFGLGIGAMLLASALYPGVHGQIEYRERSFFAAHRVTRDPLGEFRRLVHGNTIHGQQHLDPARRREALTYYHRTGPAGKTLLTLRDDPRSNRIAFIGMGAGALASYGQNGQHWTFFEIDPAVVRMARDLGLFTYLADSDAEIDVVLGDGRLSLERSDEKFGLIVIDAFTSDSIPTHLLTREALRIYREHLTPDGLLLFHISNRYLNLEPIVARLAADAEPAMTCYAWSDRSVDRTEQENGKQPSHWMLLASRPEDAAKVVQRSMWQRVEPLPETPVWRDDYTNLLRAFRWPGEEE